METYFLPKELRSELRKVWGIPFFNGEKEILKKFRQFSKEKKFKKVITVGDYCSLTLPSDVKIFDGKIGRIKIEKLLKFSLSCCNPPGIIEKGVWSVIKKAIRNNENVFVEGEEDLLVIPAVLLSEENTVVIYGFPGKGVCLIEVSPQIKKDLKNLLKKFKTSSKCDR